LFRLPGKPESFHSARGRPSYRRQGPPEPASGRYGFERNRLWLLKNSLVTENSQDSGDTKCLEIREHRLQRILTQFDFREFREKEFFNTHSR